VPWNVKLLAINMTENSSDLQSKPRYEILDGLRGVAAVIVVAFHIFEAHAASPLSQVINHGYLAVDFFFVLSGFVVGYAYDDRWGKMNLRGFLMRRLIRLHPMVIMGSIIGAMAFYFGQGEMFPLFASTPVLKCFL
jgi:peptidoglycan/LPS O-acetylase OafA/YrhL